MLDLPRYLQGVAEIAILAGFATLAASALRARLLPDFQGAPAYLATSVLALALLIWTAELLGTFGLFEPGPCLVVVAMVGLGIWLGIGGGWGHPAVRWVFRLARRFSRRRGVAKNRTPRPPGHPHPPQHTSDPARSSSIVVAVGLAVAAVAVVKFGIDVKPKLSTGMTGFDSTWYHGPFAAEFFQSGSTWELHFIAPQFLAWFYPANSEVFHAVGMLAFDRDLLSPLLNFGWLIGCLVACWCIGRSYGVAPWSLALGAIALSAPVFADQAGEARNDIVGTFFLLAAVAIALNALPTATRDRSVRTHDGMTLKSSNALVVVGLAAGVAAGTKLNFLLPAAVLVAGLAFVAPAGARLRSLLVGGLAALAGGGYWYLRNFAHSGNPLPWFDDIGPISLPAPDQPLGGREGHSVLGYLFDGRVWSDWFLPGLHDGLWFVWPLLLALALGGLALCLWRGTRPVLRVVAAAGLAAALAWLVAPTSASGPEGMPRGFESGLRYLVPALVLGLALLPTSPVLRARLQRLATRSPFVAHRQTNSERTRLDVGRPIKWWPAAVVAAILAAVAVGYPVQRHYLEHRYADPSFAAPGLNAAFAWSRDISDARIATTGTRQYPLFGTDLSNHVQFVGSEQPHGGFTAPTSCHPWRQLLNADDYVIATRDRIEPGKPPYPPTARWTEAPGAEVVLRKRPTAVFKLTEPLDPSACR